MIHISNQFKNYINESGINIRSRKREILYARYICFNYLRGFNMTLEAVGSIFDKAGKNGGIDHATVLNGVREYKKLCEQNYRDFDLLRIKIESEIKQLEFFNEKFEFSPIDEAQCLLSLERQLIKNFPIFTESKSYSRAFLIGGLGNDLARG